MFKQRSTTETATETGTGLMAWPDKERRQEYVELLITLNADMKQVKESIHQLSEEIGQLNSFKTDLNWIRWVTMGGIAWLGGLTAWFLKRYL